MPTIKWNLYPEVKPTEGKWYLVTRYDEDNKKQVDIFQFLGRWFYGPCFAKPSTGVVAWAEMPEPYVGGDE